MNNKIVLFPLLLLCCITSLLSDPVENHYQSVVNTINNRALLKNVPFSMRIIAFSIASDGLKLYYEKKPDKKEEIISVIEKMVHLALGPSVSPFKHTRLDTKLNDHCLYLAHLNVILSNYHLITGKNNYFAVQTKINNYLLARTREEKDFHVPSFPGQSLKFPADQSVVIYSLALYDSSHNLTLSTAIRKSYLAYMDKKGLNSKYSLPVSEVTGNIWYAPYPRGCATSYIVYYMSRIDPERARTYWNNYTAHYKGGFAGYSLLREWPDNKEDKKFTSGLAAWKKKYGPAGDVDSGPIVAGYGAAATGLGVLGAKGAGDTKTYKQLTKTIDTGMKILKKVNKNFSRRLDNFLTRAILFTAGVM